MTKRLIFVVTVVLLIVATVMIVGAIPLGIRSYLAYVIVPVAVLWFLWSWSKWRAKQRGDQNELDVLEETVQEHERGRHDNTDYIKKQIFFIERDHKPTPACAWFRESLAAGCGRRPRPSEPIVVACPRAGTGELGALNFSGAAKVSGA
jgi:hypothetical protein